MSLATKVERNLRDYLAARNELASNRAREKEPGAAAATELVREATDSQPIRSQRLSDKAASK